MTTLRATSYATRQDLATYIACRDGGGSSGHCTSTAGGGDNGVGAWGDATWRTDQAWCALGPSLTLKHRAVRVTLFDKDVPLGQSFVCLQGDKGDEGVIDLNPGCLLRAGLDPDTELEATAQVEFLNDESTGRMLPEEISGEGIEAHLHETKPDLFPNAEP